MPKRKCSSKNRKNKACKTTQAQASTSFTGFNFTSPPSSVGIGWANLSSPPTLSGGSGWTSLSSQLFSLHRTGRNSRRNRRRMPRHRTSTVTAPPQLPNVDLSNPESIECAICLQTASHPVVFPCSHIFCFLCAKGICNLRQKCAMCRRTIPPDYILNPVFLLPEDKQQEPPATETSSSEDKYEWFYEGRNGWWQYDEQTSAELEMAYTEKQKKCDIMVAGFLYTVDFDDMIQFRQNEPGRRRRIKRDQANTDKKGVAGIRMTAPPQPTPPAKDTASSNPQQPEENNGSPQPPSADIIDVRPSDEGATPVPSAIEDSLPSSSTPQPSFSGTTSKADSSPQQVVPVAHTIALPHHLSVISPPIASYVNMHNYAAAPDCLAYPFSSLLITDTNNFYFHSFPTL